MHAVIRTYLGPNAAQFIDALVGRTAEIERLIAGVEGFVSYSLVRTAEGGVSISVYQTQQGAEASSRRVAEFIDTTMIAQHRVTPRVSDGEVLLHLDS